MAQTFINCINAFGSVYYFYADQACIAYSSDYATMLGNETAYYEYDTLTTALAGKSSSSHKHTFSSNNHSHTYTDNYISSINSATITPAGTVCIGSGGTSYTPSGTVSTTTGGSTVITSISQSTSSAVCSITLPSLSFSAAGNILTIGFSSGCYYTMAVTTGVGSGSGSLNFSGTATNFSFVGTSSSHNHGFIVDGHSGNVGQTSVSGTTNEPQ